MKRIGKQSWEFENKPKIIGASSVVGPEEGEGPLKDYFDYVYDNLELGEKPKEGFLNKQLKWRLRMPVYRKMICSFLLAAT